MGHSDGINSIYCTELGLNLEVPTICIRLMVIGGVKVNGLVKTFQHTFNNTKSHFQICLSSERFEKKKSPAARGLLLHLLNRLFTKTNSLTLKGL